ncbi:unnamed protein product, partial [Rotaria sp. Silwood1]
MQIDIEFQNQPSRTSYTSEVEFDEDTSIDDQEQTVEQAEQVDVATNRLTKPKHRVSKTIGINEILPNPSEPITFENDPSPIIGYAAEPILPLPLACAPLFDILYNLVFYVQLALDETPENPPNGLTVHESAAIRLYTLEWETPHKSLYSMLNYTLKSSNREELRPYFKYMKLFLTALVKIPCEPITTVWRGVKKDLSAELQPGTPLTWWSFSSCTKSLTVLENNMYLGTVGERTLFSVEAINGRIISDHSHFATEDEVLLLPGTHMVVVSHLVPSPNLYIIHLKQVIPEETLLEPPFKGALLYPKPERSWYKKKRYVLPLSLFIILSITAIVIGAVLGSRKTNEIPKIICKDPYSSQSVSQTGKTPVALAFGDFRNEDIIDLAVLNYDEQSFDL